MVVIHKLVGRMGMLAAMVVVAVVALFLLGVVPAMADGLSKFQDKFTLTEIIPGADRLGPEEGDPASAVAYRGDKVVGYVFLNSAVVNATGYSGKPIHVVIGLDTKGVITGAKMVKHHEPIVLVGIPVRKIHTFIDKYKGFDILSMVKTGKDEHTIDIVSGATVTVMIIDDTIIRSAIQIARARGVGGLQSPKDIQPKEMVSLKPALNEIPNWQTMLGEGSLRRLSLSVGEITAAFSKDGKALAAARPESDNPEASFIDLYAASADIPSVGQSLLGPREFANLKKALAPGEHAIVLGGRGLYSFKGSGYVRGGIFDRFQLIQGDISVRFRDKHHKNLGAFEAEGTPDLREMELFVIPADSGFDPAKPWRIQLLVLRAVGAIKKQFITFDLGYIPPERYLDRKPVETAKVAGKSGAMETSPDGRPPLWEKIWLSKVHDIVVLFVVLGVLTGIFFFQNSIVLFPSLTKWTRIVFLAVIVVWMGLYEQAQLSVVNALTFAGSMLHGFSWDYFLMEPLIFILWASVAASLLFWGRGAYCGWLCPFGALQELINKVSRRLGVRQLKVPWSLHERLWPLKYVLFLGLFGLSLYSLTMAEQLAEVEPFKTAIILNFVREWSFVLYAVSLLAVGVFIERFFCRYICPLGGALGIPGRLRMNEWLRRHKECGTTCQRCANECMVQAIHPEGHINPNECLQCLHCQTLYYDDQRCPPMIQKRLKRERRLALSTPETKEKEASITP